MAKEFDDDFLDDDLGLDDELAGLMDEAGLSETDKTDERSPVTATLKDAAAGVIGSVTDDPIEAATDIARAAIPYEISSDVNRIIDIKDSVANELGSVAKEFKHTGKATLKSIEKVLPKDSKIHKLTQSLLDKLSDGESTDGFNRVTQADLDKQELEKGILESLGAQHDTQKYEIALREQLAQNRHKSAQELQASVLTNIEKMSRFDFEITNSFYRRSLELNYKQLFTSKETLGVLKVGVDTFKTQLEAIAKNTSLPDVVKINTKEALGESIAVKARNEFSDALYNDFNPTNKIKQNIKNKIYGYKNEVLEQMQNATQMADGVAMINDLGEYGPSKAEMAGSIVGSFGKQMLGDYIGGKISSSEQGRDAMYKVKMASMSPEAYLAELAGKQNQDSWFGRQVSNVLNFGSKMVDPNDSNTKHLSTFQNVDQDAATSFDNRAHNSIVKIIPGLLSKIYGELKSQRTQDDPTENELYFDNDTNDFRTKSEFKAKITADLDKKISTSLAYYTKDFEKLLEESGVKFKTDESKIVTSALTKYLLSTKNTSVKALMDPEKAFLQSLDPKLSKKTHEALESLVNVKGKKDFSILDRLYNNIEQTIKTSPLGNLANVASNLHKQGYSDITKDLGIVKHDENLKVNYIDRKGTEDMVVDRVRNMDQEKVKKDQDSFNDSREALGLRRVELDPEKIKAKAKKKQPPKNLTEAYRKGKDTLKDGKAKIKGMFGKGEETPTPPGAGSVGGASGFAASVGIGQDKDNSTKTLSESIVTKLSDAVGNGAGFTPTLSLVGRLSAIRKIKFIKSDISIDMQGTPIGINIDKTGIEQLKKALQDPRIPADIVQKIGAFKGVIVGTPDSLAPLLGAGSAAYFSELPGTEHRHLLGFSSNIVNDIAGNAAIENIAAFCGLITHEYEHLKQGTEGSDPLIIPSMDNVETPADFYSLMIKFNKGKYNSIEHTASLPGGKYITAPWEKEAYEKGHTKEYEILRDSGYEPIQGVSYDKFNNYKMKDITQQLDATRSVNYPAWKAGFEAQDWPWLFKSDGTLEQNKVDELFGRQSDTEKPKLPQNNAAVVKSKPKKKAKIENLDIPSEIPDGGNLFNPEKFINKTKKRVRRKAKVIDKKYDISGKAKNTQEAAIKFKDDALEKADNFVIDALDKIRGTQVVSKEKEAELRKIYYGTNPRAKEGVSFEDHMLEHNIRMETDKDGNKRFYKKEAKRGYKKTKAKVEELSESIGAKLKSNYEDLKVLSKEESEKLSTIFFNSEEFKANPDLNFKDYLASIGFKLPNDFFSIKYFEDKYNDIKTNGLKTVKNKLTEVAERFKLKEIKDETIEEFRQLFYNSKEYKDGLIDDFELWLKHRGFRIGGIFKNINIKGFLKKTRELDRKIFKATIGRLGQGIKKIPWAVKNAGMLAGKVARPLGKLSAYAADGLASTVGLGFMGVDEQSDDPIKRTLGKTRKLDKQAIKEAPEKAKELIATAGALTGQALKGSKNAAKATGKFVYDINTSDTKKDKKAPFVPGGVGGAAGFVSKDKLPKKKGVKKQKTQEEILEEMSKKLDKPKTSVFDTDGDGKRQGDWRDRLNLFKKKDKVEGKAPEAKEKKDNGLLSMLGLIVPAITGLVGIATKMAKSLFGLPKLLSWVGKGIWKIPSLLTGIGSALLKLPTTLGSIIKGAGGLLSGAASAVSGFATAAWDKTKEVAKNAWDKTKNIVAKGVEKVKSVASAISEKAKSLAGKVKNMYGTLKNKLVKKVGEKAATGLLAKVAARILPAAAISLLLYDTAMIILDMTNNGTDFKNAVSKQLLGFDIFDSKEIPIGVDGKPIKPDDDIVKDKPSSIKTDSNASATTSTNGQLPANTNTANPGGLNNNQPQQQQQPPQSNTGFFANAWNNTKSAVGGMWNAAATAATNVGTSITETASSWWDSAKTAVSNGFEAVKEAVMPKGKPAEMEANFVKGLRANGITNPVAIANITGQVAEETGFRRLEEDLRYKVPSLKSKFASRLSPGQAEAVAGDPVATANAIYGGKWGAENLGNTSPGDGYKYRGRGFIQLTGKGNYAAASKRLKIDLVNNPDIVATDTNIAAATTIDYLRNRVDRGTKKTALQLAEEGQTVALGRAINIGSSKSGKPALNEAKRISETKIRMQKYGAGGDLAQSSSGTDTVTSGKHKAKPAHYRAEAQPKTTKKEDTGFFGGIKDAFSSGVEKLSTGAQKVMRNVEESSLGKSVSKVNAGITSGYNNVVHGDDSLKRYLGKGFNRLGGEHYNGMSPDFRKRFEMMAAEYLKNTGRSIQITDGYRSISEQADLKRRKPDLAATPGSSLHNFGWAMDIHPVQANELAAMKLLDKYGFHRPLLHRKKNPEAWHLETKGINLKSLAKDPAMAKIIARAQALGKGKGNKAAEAELSKATKAANSKSTTQANLTGGEDKKPEPLKKEPSKQLEDSAVVKLKDGVIDKKYKPVTGDIGVEKIASSSGRVSNVGSDSLTTYSGNDTISSAPVSNTKVASAVAKEETSKNIVQREENKLTPVNNTNFTPVKKETVKTVPYNGIDLPLTAEQEEKRSKLTFFDEMAYLETLYQVHIKKDTTGITEPIKEVSNQQASLTTPTAVAQDTKLAVPTDNLTSNASLTTHNTKLMQPEPNELSMESTNKILSGVSTTLDKSLEAQMQMVTLLQKLVTTIPTALPSVKDKEITKKEIETKNGLNSKPVNNTKSKSAFPEPVINLKRKVSF